MTKIKAIKELLYLAIIGLLIAVCAQLYYDKKIEPASHIQVYYNHERKLNEELIKLIDESQEFIFFSVYTFTRFDIKDALIAAKQRGVNVIGVTENQQIGQIKNQRDIVFQLRSAGIPMYFNKDNGHIMHLKILVTEKAYASGSYNWTTTATNENDEVLEVGTDPSIRSHYQDIVQKVIMKYQGNLFPVQ